MAALRVGSLFSGIGGFELGLERAGMEVAWSCDVEPFAQHILKKHWPDVPVYTDIKTLKGAEVEPVDVVCGGFPCQDISAAGKGAGIAEGTRSGLWSEYARLVGELRPRYVIVENVQRLRTKGLGRVLGDLSLLGYDAEWDRIRASDVGAPHQRARLWIVAYPQREPLRNESGWRTGPVRPAAPLAGFDGEERGVADTHGVARRARRPGDASEGSRGRDVGRGCIGSDFVADTHEVRRDGRPRVFGPSGWGESANSRSAWTTEPDVGRVAHGVPARVDRLTALGNALIPQIAEWIGRRIVDYESGVDAGVRNQEGVS